MEKVLLSLFLVLVLSSCKAVKPYERQYVSDPEMQMQNDTGKNFNLYVQSIREGATPAGSAKGSGGCGCN
jgi:hypothetical protein